MMRHWRKLLLLGAVLAIGSIAFILFRPVAFEISEQIDRIEINAHGIYEVRNKEVIFQFVQLVNETTFRKRIFSQKEAPNDLIAIVALMQEDSVVASIVVSGSSDSEKVYVLDDTGAYVAYNGKNLVSYIDDLIN